jgi:Ca2+-binding EF-hand superfamily protein
MDKFGCGSISVAELRHLLYCNREKYELTEAQIDDIIKLFGPVQNGQVECRQLLRSMLN